MKGARPIAGANFSLQKFNVTPKLSRSAADENGGLLDIVRGNIDVITSQVPLSVWIWTP